VPSRYDRQQDLQATSIQSTRHLLVALISAADCHRSSFVYVTTAGLLATAMNDKKQLSKNYNTVRDRWRIASMSEEKRARDKKRKATDEAKALLRKKLKQSEEWDTLSKAEQDAAVEKEVLRLQAKQYVLTCGQETVVGADTVYSENSVARKLDEYDEIGLEHLLAKVDNKSVKSEPS